MSHRPKHQRSQSHNSYRSMSPHEGWAQGRAQGMSPGAQGRSPGMGSQGMPPREVEDWQRLIPPLPNDFDFSPSKSQSGGQSSNVSQGVSQGQFNQSQSGQTQFNQNQRNHSSSSQGSQSHSNGSPNIMPGSFITQRPPNTYRHSFHTQNQFHVKNDLPTYVQNQLSNPTKFKRSGTNPFRTEDGQGGQGSGQSQNQNPIQPSQKSGPPNQIPPNQIPSNQGPQNQIPPNQGSQPGQIPGQINQTPGQINQTPGQIGQGPNFTGARKKSIKKRTKICRKCGKEITGQFVRALNSSFHVECFCCNECGKQCSSKFFPYEITDPSTNVKYQVALCEYDYFKKLNLICFNCDNALRGPYITALGNKYHLEHFKCNVCHKVFESDESYYEHEGNIYCHYHYSKKFANHCEGCNSSIVKQFVELFRGGRNQQWHPECYMVNKFWNVTISREFIGDKKLLQTIQQYDELPESELLVLEQAIENLVVKIWMTLSSFEELTASCISDMLLNACVGNQFNGLLSTGKLILYVEVLFKAIDSLVPLHGMNGTPSPGTPSAGDEEFSFQDQGMFLKKEPRNVSGKIMSYLAILRKAIQINLNGSGALSSELLSVITGCAHYLKLLIRIGLQNALKLNRLRMDNVAVEGFLAHIKTFEKLSSDNFDVISDYLIIPLNSVDFCKVCNKSIEKACYKFDNDRCHEKCFRCSNCKKPLVEDELFGEMKVKIDETDGKLYCGKCHAQNQTIVKVESVSDLEQLAYLLKIAFLRSKQLMLHKPRANNKTLEKEQKLSYSNTLKDITQLRTKRENQNLSNSIKKDARKSVILDAPKGENAPIGEDTILSMGSEDKELQRNGSMNSESSFILSQDDNEVFIKKLNIKDEPPTKRVMSNNQNQLNRTSDLLKNEKSLTLDDIPRIVAAEQARDQRPNAFKHHNSLYQRTASKSMELKPLQQSPSSTYGHSPGRDDIPAEKFENTSLVDKKVKYYSELDKSQHFILRHIAVEALVQLLNNKYSKTELLGLIHTKKAATFWDKFKFGHGESKSINGVFGVELKDVTKKYGIDSDLGVGPAKLRIPIVIDDIINSLKTKDMSVEGIFRLNGNIKKLKQLTADINNNPLKSPDFSQHSAVQLAALMKKWLRELPTPLLTFNLFDLWIESQRNPDSITKKRLMKLVYCMLPRSHRNLVEVLLNFFKWASSFAEIDEESGSKMDVHNIATVISPNLLYSRSDSDPGDMNLNSSGEGYFLAIEVVNQLIEMHEELSVIPDDLLEFFEALEYPGDGKEPTTKDIMGKIERYSKDHPKFFVTYDIKDENSDPLNHEVRSNTILRGLSKVTEHHGENDSV
ncbi:rho-GTPase-activating protein Lrg1p [[Candida] jaroonii]|uniref:Rho-GTPase-activating protein Lrg1p n=1 Tax=[Candida] jaroonii TaxID=467808 RepID=A0ACA9Y7H8_9ASCO|nr:rho-GTPase-activating protein Lrg1p [[Candida] jaroonii]